MNFKINSNEDIEGYLVGLIIGDGHIEPNKRIVIASNNKKYIEKVSLLIDKIGYKHSLFYDKSATVWKISINSEKLHKIFTKIYKIPTGNKTFQRFKPKLKNNQLCHFISGIFDAEGWVELDKGKYFRLRIKLKNPTIISYIKQILDSMEFETRSHKKSEGSIVVEINKQKNVKKFYNTFQLFHDKWLLENSLVG